MQQERIDIITEALYSYSASVLKEGILQYATIEELLELSLNTNERIAFRAAWALEHVLLGNQNGFLEKYIDSILEVYKKSNNWSVLRSVTKLVITYLSINKNKKLNDDDVELIINKTFDILENSTCPIAVRCNCYDILYLFYPQHNWIAHELVQRIQLDLTKQETPALTSRANRILKKLERITKA